MAHQGSSLPCGKRAVHMGQRVLPFFFLARIPERNVFQFQSFHFFGYSDALPVLRDLCPIVHKFPQCPGVKAVLVSPCNTLCETCQHPGGADYGVCQHHKIPDQNGFCHHGAVCRKQPHSLKYQGKTEHAPQQPQNTQPLPVLLNDVQQAAVRLLIGVIQNVFDFRHADFLCVPGQIQHTVHIIDLPYIRCPLHGFFIFYPVDDLAEKETSDHGKKGKQSRNPVDGKNGHDHIYGRAGGGAHFGGIPHGRAGPFKSLGGCFCIGVVKIRVLIAGHVHIGRLVKKRPVQLLIQFRVRAGNITLLHPDLETRGKENHQHGNADKPGRFLETSPELRRPEQIFHENHAEKSPFPIGKKRLHKTENHPSGIDFPEHSQKIKII